MKLPELRSAPVQRLALPEPEVEAAGFEAARQAAGGLAKFAMRRNEQAAAADYSDRYSKISSHDVSVRGEILENPYMRVSDLPDDVEYEPGVVENRYNEETDTIEEMVPTHEIADSYYRSRMDEFIGEQADGARNSLVGDRLRSDSLQKIIAPSREQLLKYSLEQAEFHDRAKFQVALDEYVRAGDEAAAMELIARAVTTLGINGEAALAKLGSDLDVAYFQRGAQAAKTRLQTQALRDELDSGEWRFDQETELEIYGALVKQESALYALEEDQFEARSEQLTAEALFHAQTGALSPAQLHEMRGELTLSDYKVLQTAARTGEVGFRTPSDKLAQWDMLVEQAKLGYYPAGIESFADARAFLMLELNRQMFPVDPVTGTATQAMASSDYVRLSREIREMDELAFQTPGYRQSVDRIYTMVAGASKDAWMGSDPTLQANLDAAMTALNTYVREEGPQADPVAWVDDNLKRYVINAARERLLQLPSGDTTLFRFTNDGYVDYRTSLAELHAAINSRDPDDPQVTELRRKISVLDEYRRMYPDNVRNIR